jgi:hypothetical protein
MRIRVFLDDIAMDYMIVTSQLWADWLGFMLRLNPELHFKYPQKFWINNPGRWTSLGWHVPYNPLITPPPEITPEVRPLWAHIPRGGDLCLGLGVSKPTLWHCYKEGNSEPVISNSLGHSSRLEPELTLHFGNRLPSTNISRQVTVENWLRRKGLRDRVDLSDPRYQYHGEPLLATLVSHNHLAVMSKITAQSTIHSFQILLD